MLYVQALGPTIVAITAALIAGYIAWRQWRTAHDRLKMDMYEKRFAAYDATKRLLNITQLQGQITQDDLDAFRVAIRGREFLFDGKARDFIEKIQGLAFSASNLRGRLADYPDHPSRNTLVDQTEDIIQFLSQQDKNLEALFRPYLSLSHIGVGTRYS